MRLAVAAVAIGELDSSQNHSNPILTRLLISLIISAFSALTSLSPLIAPAQSRILRSQSNSQSLSATKSSQSSTTSQNIYPNEA